jgi:DNA polymerase-1
MLEPASLRYRLEITKTTMSQKSKLFLIDGNGLAYRAFYAVPAVHTSRGTPANAVVGFFDLVVRLLAEEKPTHVAVAFDKGVPTERVSEYQDFNAHRVEMPEELAAQLPTIEDAVRAFGIQVFRVRGHQGDDCLGTLAKKADEEGMDVIVLSGDLDLLQLVSPNVKVVTFRRGISDLIVYDEEIVSKRFNLKPKQLADLRALAGDSSDNITGVPGIGEVTAKKLLSQHGSLVELLDSLDQLPAKWRNPLSENREMALDFLTRAAIRDDLDVVVDWEKCRYQGLEVGRVRDIFVRLELEELLDSLTQLDGVQVLQEIAPPEAEVMTGKKAKTALSAMVKKSKEPINLLFLGSGEDLVGMVISSEDSKIRFFPFVGAEDCISAEECVKALKPAMKDATRRKNVHNLRAFLMLDLSAGLDENTGFFDVAIASHLIDSVEGNPWFDEICRRHGIEIPGEGALLGRGVGARKLSEVPVDELARWAAYRVRGLEEIAVILETKLVAQNLLEQFQQVEMPLAWVFAQMEASGVCLDDAQYTSLQKTVDARLKEAEASIQKLAGSKFDVDDPKDLAEVLFDKLSIIIAARPKNGSPIGNDIIAQVGQLHPIGLIIKDYRGLKDLKESLVSSKVLFAEPRFGWFHRLTQHPVASSERLLWMGPTAVGGAAATYNRLLAEIQSLPNESLRQELERDLLACIVPREKGKVLLGINFPDLPLKLVAHLSHEQELVKGFIRNEQVESNLLNQIGLEPQQSEQGRRDSLQALLGSIGAYRFAQSQGLALQEGEDRIRNFLTKLAQKFPQMHRYLTEQLESAKQEGWVSSLKGRRRNLPEMNSRNSDIRGTAERVARSASIQASAADLLKAALIAFQEALKEAKIPAKFALQLEDEVILELDAKNQNKVLPLLEKSLSNLTRLDVPYTLAFRVGKNLAETQELKQESSVC